MKTIAQHNAERSAAFEQAQKTKWDTGLLCPRCNDGTELKRFDPNAVLASMPPQIEVVCPNCKFRDYVLA